MNKQELDDAIRPVVTETKKVSEALDRIAEELKLKREEDRRAVVADYGFRIAELERDGEREMALFLSKQLAQVYPEIEEYLAQ